MNTRNVLGYGVTAGLAFAAGCLAYALASTANAAPGAPEAPSATFGSILTYQGRLSSSTGVPVNGPVQAVFRIYTDTQIAAIWTQTQTITPTNGLFTAYLGGIPAIGTSVFTRAAYIGVQIGSDSEMLPRTPLNSVIGHADNSTLGAAGVIGNNSGGGTGVYGSSPSSSGIGVLGLGSGVGVAGSSSSGFGVQGNTQNDASAGGFFSGPRSDSNAIRIGYGTIQVSGANTNTHTMAYIQHVVAGASGNLCFGGRYTVISNTLAMGDPNAMIFVTANSSGGAPSPDSPVFVIYPPAPVSDCPPNYWLIGRTDANLFSAGQQFNVMILRRY